MPAVGTVRVDRDIEMVRGTRRCFRKPVVSHAGVASSRLLRPKQQGPARTKKKTAVPNCPSIRGAVPRPHFQMCRRAARRLPNPIAPGHIHDGVFFIIAVLSSSSTLSST